MKGIKLFCILLSAAAMSGCFEDKGNYDYIQPEEVLPVTVKDLPENVTFDLNSRGVLTPVIEGLPKSEDSYEFTWYTYPENAMGYIPVRDTICREKALDFLVAYPPGVGRVLVYTIKDKQTGVCSITRIKMSVRAVAIGAGYYVAKDIDGQTDVDYISDEGEQHFDILTFFLKRRLEGNAVKVFYQSANYTHIIAHDDGTTTTLRNQGVLHVFSERDGCTLNAGTFELFKTFEQMFYSPVEHAPTDFYCGRFSKDQFIMNNGNVHGIVAMSGNAGIFGDSKLMEDNSVPKLFPSFLPSHTPAAVLCFDMPSRSFCYANAYETKMANAPAPPADLADLPDVVGMDMEPIALIDRMNSEYHRDGAPAWALMKSVSQPAKFYVADIVSSESSYPFVDFDELADSRRLPHGKVFAANRLTNAIYFANGNKISYYLKNAEDADSEEFALTFGEGQLTEGEEVVFMDHLYPVSEEFAVLTNSGSGWKLYLFPVILGTARLDTANAKIFTGTGNARHLIKR